ncbi:FUSC family protein [Peptostreptococcus faecalis]|uniref:FUSC family protein n=1 Tax=Peptostreptococcus faecalis TaxID=2045015 RepID=UPI000C7D9B27|nr:aromatic acid exporter family protein [Peptostreptococcus faecalis]
MAKKFTKVGLRTKKTALAVFICFMIESIVKTGSPFYAAIATILCIQNDMSNSFRVAKNREIATIVGAIWGVVFIYFEQRFMGDYSEIIRYLVLSLMLVPIIQSSLIIKKQECTYLMCVVFLCITIMHGADENPMIFAWCRVLETSIGIIVSLAVNSIPFHRLTE